MKTNIELVQGQLEAYNSLDLEMFCSFYHDEVETRDLLKGKVLISGMTAFRASYHKLFETYPNQKCILKSRIVKDISIIDEELITGRSHYPNGLHVVAIYGFRDGLIEKVWFL